METKTLFKLQSLIPARLLEPFRSKRKVLYHPPDADMLKLPPEHDLIQNTPENYVVTPHRKRRPGFHNSPTQNPPFVPYNHGYIEDLRSRKGPPSSSAPPSYFQSMLIFFFCSFQFIQYSKSFYLANYTLSAAAVQSVSLK